MGPTGAIAALALLAGCVEQVPLALPDLAGARSMLLVASTRGAQVAQAVALDDGLALPVAVDVEVGTDLVAFLYDQELAALRLTAGPVAIAGQTACGRRVPTASRLWSRRVARAGGGDWAPASGPELANLRITASTGACPRAEVLRSAWVDVRCGTTTCGAHVEQVGCELRIDTGLCQLGVLEGRVGASGELCFAPSQYLGACDERTPGASDRVTLDCTEGGRVGECAIELVPRPSAPTLEVATAPVTDLPPVSDPDHNRPSIGYVTDVAVLDDRVLVAARDDPAGAGCELGPGTKLVAFDPDALTVIATSTLPPCAHLIAADPTTDGFLAVLEPHAPRLGRFSREGRLLASVPWTDVASDRSPLAIVVIPGPPARAAVILSTGVTGLPSRLFVVDLERFVEVPFPTPIGDSVDTLEPYEGAKILALDNSFRIGRIVDLEAGTVRDGPSTVGTPTPGVRVGDVAWVPAVQRFLITIDKGSGGIFAFDPRFTPMGRALAYERYAQTWNLMPWPARPELVLVSLIDLEGEFTGAVALVDPLGPRILPGAVVVGRGPLLGGVADRRGRVFALLPWTGELVRISPP